MLLGYLPTSALVNRSVGGEVLTYLFHLFPPPPQLQMNPGCVPWTECPFAAGLHQLDTTNTSSSLISSKKNPVHALQGHSKILILFQFHLQNGTHSRTNWKDHLVTHQIMEVV